MQNVFYHRTDLSVGRRERGSRVRSSAVFLKDRWPRSSRVWMLRPQRRLPSTPLSRALVHPLLRKRCCCTSVIHKLIRQSGRSAPVAASQHFFVPPCCVWYVNSLLTYTAVKAVSPQSFNKWTGTAPYLTARECCESLYIYLRHATHSRFFHSSARRNITATKVGRLYSPQRG